MMKGKPITCISFYDHAMGDGAVEPVVCDVFGVLVKEDTLCYYIASWVGDGLVDTNTEMFAILKSTVIKKRRLK